MNKKEIIEYIKDEIENETDTFHWFDDTPNNPTRKQIEESINAHQGILDLVQKQEKEIKDLKFKNEVYKKKAKIDEKVIDEMIPIIYDYSNLGYLGICPAELENGCLNLGVCKYFAKQDINCLKCIKQYFYRKVENE